MPKIKIQNNKIQFKKCTIAISLDNKITQTTSSCQKQRWIRVLIKSRLTLYRESTTLFFKHKI